MNKQAAGNKKPSKKTLVISAIVLAVLIVAAVFFSQPLIDLLKDPDQTRATIEQSGPWGPVIFILLQVVQVLIAPIPGQAVGFIGGYLFGTLLGTTYAMIGAAIGFTLIFVLARKFGRPFVEYFVDKKHLEKFDYLVADKGVLVLFLIFLLPAFPDDIICYIAGLTKIKIRTLILISLAGRLPGYLLLSLTGSGVAESNNALVITVTAIMAVIGIVGFWQRKNLERLVKRLAKRS